MEKQDSVTVFEADIPEPLRRGCAKCLTVVLTTDSNPDLLSDAKSSKSSSSYTLQVPDTDFLFDLRRRSLGSNESKVPKEIRRSSAPSRRASCGWGPIWELRKQFLPHKRRLSASSGDHQVVFLRAKRVQIIGA